MAVIRDGNRERFLKNPYRVREIDIVFLSVGQSLAKIPFVLHYDECMHVCTFCQSGPQDEVRRWVNRRPSPPCGMGLGPETLQDIVIEPDVEALRYGTTTVRTPASQRSSASSVSLIAFASRGIVRVTTREVSRMPRLAISSKPGSSCRR